VSIVIKFLTLSPQHCWSARSSVHYLLDCGPGSSVGIATEYGLDGPRPNPSGGEIFPPVHTGPGAHPVSCKIGTGSFPGVKCGRGVLLTTHPLLVPRSWKNGAISLPTLWATPGLQRDHFTFFTLKWTHFRIPPFLRFVIVFPACGTKKCVPNLQVSIH